jgi:hypothetical protein
MSILFLLIFLALDFGPPFAWGYTGAPAWTSLIWSVVMAVGAVTTGWRAPQRGMFISLLIGACFAAIWCVPGFFLGRWMLRETAMNHYLIITIIAALIIGIALLFGKKAMSGKTKPFPRAGTDWQDWFAHTPPWNRIDSTVIDAILDGITYKTLLEVFVLASMKYGLVTRYEPLGGEDSSPTVIRSQISHILCQTGNPAVLSLAQALEATQTDAAQKALMMAVDSFEPAIALAKNQIAAYAGMAVVCGLVGKRTESHDYAKRGLVEVAEMRAEMGRLNLSGHESPYLHPDGLDQVERQLCTCLEN